MIEFTPRTWKNGEAGDTAVAAAQLNRMEDGIAAAVDGVNAVPSTVDAVLADPESDASVRLSATIADVGDARYAGRLAAAPIALQSRTATVSEHPTLRRLDTAWFPFAAQGAPSMLWLAPVDMRGWPGAIDNIYVFYSTDHGQGSSTTGIHLATMSDWDGSGLNYVGLVYSLQGSAAYTQPETPSVWLDWDAGLIRALIQINTGVIPDGEVQATQSTFMITSATGLAGSWTLIPTDAMPWNPNTPGPPQTSYANPFRISGSLFAYSLMGGSGSGSGAMAGFGLWRSSHPQGIPGSWTADHGRISMGESIVDLAGYQYGWNVKLIYATVVDYRGKAWFVGTIGPSTAGLEDTLLCDVYTAPLSTDFRRFTSRPVKITPPRGSWGFSDKIGLMGRAMQYDDKIVIPFREDTKTTDWGAFVLEGGAS